MVKKIRDTNIFLDLLSKLYRYKHLAKIDAEIVYKKTSLGASVRYNDFMKNIDWISVQLRQYFHT